VRPIIGITIGDPAGIGPEIVIKALLNPEIYEACTPVTIGDSKLLERISKQIGIKAIFNTISYPHDAISKFGTIDIIDLKNVDAQKLRIGRISKMAGKAALEYIETAVKHGLNTGLDAVVTAPINKKSIRLAGSKHMGHTELFAALTSSSNVSTMFLVKDARIFFLSRHLPLWKAITLVKKEKIITAITMIENLLLKLGLKNPKIAVAALNPHASDDGLMGNEEEKEIIPAIEELRAKNFDIVGPIPADTVFHQAILGTYDAVLSLYHDQGHIAAKTADFHGTVSATLGLPFIRTSVDHGTAFDIAGKGLAKSKSLEEAIRAAINLTSQLIK